MPSGTTQVIAYTQSEVDHLFKIFQCEVDHLLQNEVDQESKKIQVDHLFLKKSKLTTGLKIF